MGLADTGKQFIGWRQQIGKETFQEGPESKYHILCFHFIWKLGFN